MKKSEYARMAEREQNYWWHLGRLRIIEEYLKAYARKRRDLKILNIGCGTGGTVRMLEKYGHVDNADVSEDALAFMRSHGYTNGVKVDGIELPFANETYDLVVAFDVLEHIHEDVEALREWRRLLRPDGAVILTVPAYQWLWTAHDVSLHHFRRHTIGSVRTKANAAGLRMGKRSYAFVFSLPMVVGFRALNKMLGRKTNEDSSYVNVPNFVNSLFSWILYGEAALHRFLSFPAGTSVVATLHKNEQ